MSKAPVKMIDLDAVVEDTLAVRLHGKSHELKPVSFGDFLQNMKDLEKMGKAPSVEEELELTKRLLLRAFPSMTSEDIDAMTMGQMKLIVSEAHKFNGQDDGAKSATEEAKANPPQAA